MRFLIRDAWLAAEIDRLGLDDVTPDDVDAEVERFKTEQFKSDAEFAEYLRDSRQTYADLARRARVSLRAKRIEEHVTAPAGDEPQEAERLRVRHAHRFIERWRKPTTCARRFVISDCANYRR